MNKVIKGSFPSWIPEMYKNHLDTKKDKQS